MASHDQVTDEQMDTIRSIMKGQRTAMMVTVAQDGSLHSHPMTTQEAEFDGDCWFIGSSESDSVKQLAAESKVNLSYAGPSAWLSIAGNAEVVHDEAKKKELWNTFTDVWFENGENDPKIVLIRITAESAQYWETPGRLATVVSMLKTKVTGGTPDVGDSASVDL